MGAAQDKADVDVKALEDAQAALDAAKKDLTDKDDALVAAQKTAEDAQAALEARRPLLPMPRPRLLPQLRPLPSRPRASWNRQSSKLLTRRSGFRMPRLLLALPRLKSRTRRASFRQLSRQRMQPTRM